MYVHHSQDIAYIAHPKTASSSISHALLETGEWDLVGNHHEVSEKKLAGMRVISVVREPTDWYVSWYFHYHSDKSFYEWFRWFINTGNSHTRQGEFFGVKYSTDVLFYDRVHEGLDLVFDDVGLDRLDLQHRNQQGREGRAPELFFCQKSAQLMAERKADFLRLYADLLAERGDKVCLTM